MRPALLTVLAAVLPLTSMAKEPTPVPRARSTELFEPDMTKEFHIKQMSPYGRGGSTFQTKTAQTQNFQFQQKFSPKTFQEPKAFRAKGWWGSGFKFSTKSAATKTFETKAAETKTASVKEAPDAGKTATTKTLADRDRPFLGPESRNLQKSLDPQNLPKISNEMRELKTIEDVKELLNKN